MAVDPLDNRTNLVRQLLSGSHISEPKCPLLKYRLMAKDDLEAYIASLSSTEKGDIILTHWDCAKRNQCQNAKKVKHDISDQ